MIVSCNECIWSTRDGGCSAWNCEYIPQREAAEAWKIIYGTKGDDERARRLEAVVRKMKEEKNGKLD